MLDGLRRFLFGADLPPSGVEGIPPDARDAHHRLRNTAQRMRATAKMIDRDANDLLELLARDIQGQRER